MKKTVLMPFALLCLCLSACSAGYDSLAEAEKAGARLGECIEIDGVDVSGMAPSEAYSALEQAHREALQSIRYTVTAEEDSIEIAADLLPIAFDTEETILKALALKQYWPSSNEPRRLKSSMTAENGRLKAALEVQSEPLRRAPENASASYDKDKGCFVYAAQKDGRSIDLDALTDGISALIAEGSSGSVSVPSSPVPAEYTEDMAKADTGVIAEFCTSFSGKSYGKANRVFNITKAAGLIDGVTVAPGEEFDMNEVLGSRNRENGWKTAAAIRDGAYVQEYGGGVCQVSTTLYNVVLMADLEVTERSHHSWPSGYIDIGRDATISTGGPNFKFKNTQPVPVTISASTDAEKKTVTVRIHGRPLPDGQYIELTSKKIKSLSAPATKTEVDPSLAPGQSEIKRKPRRGSVAESYKLYYAADGSLIKKELVCRDTYRSITGITAVSPY